MSLYWQESEQDSFSTLFLESGYRKRRLIFCDILLCRDLFFSTQNLIKSVRFVHASVTTQSTKTKNFNANNLKCKKKKRTKTKSFNTNNQKYRKKQAETIKRKLILWAPISFSQGDWDKVRNENQTRVNL